MSLFGSIYIFIHWCLWATTEQMLEFELRQQRLLERQLRRQKRERAVQRELMRFFSFFVSIIQT
jgi:hypothetical protein